MLGKIFYSLPSIHFLTSPANFLEINITFLLGLYPPNRYYLQLQLKGIILMLIISYFEIETPVLLTCFRIINLEEAFVKIISKTVHNKPDPTIVPPFTIKE